MYSDSTAIAPGRGKDVADAVSCALSRGTSKRIERASQPVALPLAPLETAAFRHETRCSQFRAVSRGRRRLWQLPAIYHCSLLGVCLGLDEMRRVASRLGLSTSARASDYEIHHRLVHLAGSAEGEGRRLDRYLEEKFARALRAFRAHRDEAALRKGWDGALEWDEDLGGSYFALLTHPALGKELAQEAMGHVHMLSHVAASALRRIRGELERTRARVAEQEVALAREHRARARQTQRLLLLRKRASERELAARSSGPEQSEPVPPLASAPRDQVGELRDLRTRLEKSEHERRAWRRLYRRARQRIEALESDVSPAPTLPADAGPVVPTCGGPDARRGAAPGILPCDLAGRVVAYVGGRGRVVPRLRALTERCNGQFMHHDGGLQERTGRIDESLGGSDIVIVPLDCVSHDASRRLKRRCRQQGKTILWLRSASVSAFEGALRQAVQSPPASTECPSPA